ncbi:MAG: hypothetical protein ICV70_05755 [Jiangellaceae bacterium]|nr:hypothetical protein [Jiangellaceae bacterium]
MAGAAAWALAGGPVLAIATLVLIGWVFAAADAIIWRAVPDLDDDLALPAGVRAPGPPWGLVVGTAAALGLVAAVAVLALPLAGLAAAILAGTLAGPLRRDVDGAVSPAAVAVAARLRRFAHAHGTGRGQPVDGYATPVGNSGARLIVVASDGTWADAMLRPDQVATVAALARVTLRDAADVGTGQRLRTGARLWDRMTGST